MHNKTLFIMTVGHNGSGKSTVANKLQEDLNINHVDGDTVSNLIKAEVPFFHDLDISTPNEKMRIINPIKNFYRRSICKELLDRNQHVIHSGCNITSSSRAKIITAITDNKPNIFTILLHIDIPEKLLLDRISIREKATQNSHWRQHYIQNNKPIFELPTQAECDLVLHYNQQNYAEILNIIKGILEQDI